MNIPESYRDPSKASRCCSTCTHFGSVYNPGEVIPEMLRCFCIKQAITFPKVNDISQWSDWRDWYLQHRVHPNGNCDEHELKD